MTAWIIETAISLGLFYLAYIFFLRRVAFFRANRYYLLTAILFSLILPHINLSPPVSIANYSYIIPEVTITGQSNQSVQPAERAWDLSSILMFIYVVFTTLLTLRLALRMMQLYRLIKSNPCRKYRNARIINLNSVQSPFSFLNYIFINESLYGEEEKKKIIEHELVHINQHHTFDLIILELLTIIQWFNPVSWLLKKSMHEVHEYLADEEVIRKGTSIRFYQGLLMNLQLGSGFFAPVNNFNRSLTVNRIRMMTSIKPAAWKRFRVFILLPLLMILVFMCTKAEEETFAISGPSTFESAQTPGTSSGTDNQSLITSRSQDPGDTPNAQVTPDQKSGHSDPGPSSPTVQQEEALSPRSVQQDNINLQEGQSEQQLPNNLPGHEPVSETDNAALPITAPETTDNQSSPATVNDDEEVFFIVEDMPGFRGGGQDEFRQYISENLRYPQTAAENGVAGRVFVQFVVKADGSVADARIVRGIDPSLDREAMRVVMSSPKWDPGRQRGEPVSVAFTFPINFVLE